MTEEHSTFEQLLYRNWPIDCEKESKQPGIVLGHRAEKRVSSGGLRGLPHRQKSGFFLGNQIVLAESGFNSGGRWIVLLFEWMLCC